MGTNDQHTEHKEGNMGSGADMEQEAKILAGRTKGTGDFDVSPNRHPVDLFPVKMCPTCEEVECVCEEDVLRRIEEATGQIVSGMEALTVALGDFANRNWRS
jgi:hypothetical protein